MANPTTNFGWQMPTNSDLVTDLPADFEVFGQAVDTSLADLKGGTTGQILSKASGTDMDFTWVAPTTGDITGVTAGTGLSGGGTSGDVTLAIDSTVATLTGSQTLTNKDLTSGTNSFPTTLTTNSGSQTLTNKTITDPVMVETVNAQTGTTYTTVLTDAQKMVTLSNASSITVTIPPASSVAYTAGSKIDFIQKGAGQVTFAGGSGVTIRSVGATATAPKLRVQYSAATAWYEGSDIWYIVGDIS